MGRSERREHQVVRPIRCGVRCGFGGATVAHHDRLLAVENDMQALLELLETAITWGELDYSGKDVVAPAYWQDFCAQHKWRDPALMARVFDLATDVAFHSQSRCGSVSPMSALAGLGSRYDMSSPAG